MKSMPRLSLLVASLSTLAVSALSGNALAYTLEPAFPQVATELPTSLVIPPDGTNRLFLLQQRGKILILPKDESSSEAKVFLDFTGRNMEAKDGKFEEGLLGLAFHPEFVKNGKFYIAYSQQDLKRSVISEMRVSDKDSNAADLTTERILLEIPQPFWNHNSGNLLFGPDGYLYIGLGDGGKRDDVTRTAQNPFQLLGKILRIDINSRQGSRPYAIPTDNPLVSVPGARDEVYALGMRNPWGLSFDSDGTLWCADVGQDLWEEINLIEKGGNYGWSFREGARPFPIRTEAPPADAKFIEPIHEYVHTDGISITGGFVYQGDKLPKLKGAYLYGDWAFGKIWALKYDKIAKKVLSNELIYEAAKDPKGRGLMKPSAICEDAGKEVIILDWSGKLLRLKE